MNGYPGGMSRLARNKLWFANACTGLSIDALNEFTEWVADHKPVTSPQFVRSMDVRSLLSEFTEAKRAR